MGLWDNIVAGSAAELTKSIGAMIDKLATSDEEKLRAKNELSQIVLSELNKVTGFQRDIILSETDSGGSWLQRNWRPILMLCFGFILIYQHFISMVFSLPTAELPQDFWELLKLGIGGYVIGRSAEKIAADMTKNVDLPFVKKRKREVE